MSSNVLFLYTKFVWGQVGISSTILNWLAHFEAKPAQCDYMEIESNLHLSL